MNPKPRSRFRLHRSTNRSMNPRTDLRPRAFNPRAFDFAGDPEPSRYELAHQSHSLCDFDRPTNRSTFLCDFDFLLSLWSLIFFVVVVVVWLVVFWWFSCCVVVVENSIFQNVTKYMKIFSKTIFIMQPNIWKYFSFPKIAFPKNIYFSENILHWTKHSLSDYLD